MSRVLHICYNATLNGGSQLSMLALMEEQVRRGHSVFAVVPPSRSGDFATALRERGVAVRELPVPWRAEKRGTGILRKCFVVAKKMAKRVVREATELKLKLWVKKESIDIVHIGGAIIDTGLNAGIANNVPVVWHLREFVDLDFGYEWDWPNKAADDMAKASLCIAVSKAVRDHYRSMVPSGRFRVIYNGVISSDNLEISQPIWRKETTRIIFAGGLNEGKGICDVLNAAASLADDQSWTLDIYGNADPSAIRTFDRFVREKAIEERVHYKGWAPLSIRTLSNYDVALMCSRSEAFGRITAESMIAGAVVIGSDSGGTSELLANERGLLYESCDWASLARCIRMLIDDGALCQELRKRAYDYAISFYTVEANANAIEGAYGDLFQEMGN